MDFIDFLVDSSDEYLTGTFYPRRPKSSEDGGINFSYKQLDPNSRRFGKLLNNVRADVANYAISTNDHCGFNIGGYIVTQNGLIWQITEIVTNEEVKGKSDVLRWFKTAENSEQSLRMIQVDDLYELDAAYDKWCEVTIKFAFERLNLSSVKMETTDNPDEYIRGTYKPSENGVGYDFFIKVEQGSTINVMYINEDYKYSEPQQRNRTISASKTQNRTCTVTYLE